MVVEMLKHTFFLYHREYSGFLEKLRELGVVHVSIKNHVETEAKSELLDRAKELKGVILRLEKHKIESPNPQPAKSLSEWKDVLVEYDHNMALIQNYQHRILPELQPWFDFDTDRLKAIKEHGLEISFYICTDKKFEEGWKENYNLFEINNIGDKKYFIIFHKPNELPSISVDSVTLPSESIEEVKEKIKHYQSQNRLIESKLEASSLNSIVQLKKELQEVEEQLCFEEVSTGNDVIVDGKICVIEGFAPANDSQAIEIYTRRNHIYHQVEKPTDEEKEVPVKLKNGSFSKLFEPIGEIYTLPNYRELDLTPFFAPFFLLFFGFCLSDAGYGLLLLIPSLWLFMKNPSKKVKPFAVLGILFSLSTIILGFFTGTFFGINITQTSWLQDSSMRYFVLDTSSPEGTNMFMQGAVIIGAIQLLFGMVLKAINETKQKGFVYSVATLGWFVLFVSSIINALVVDSENFMNTPYIVAASISLFCIFFLNSPGKNPALNFGVGIWNAYNTVVGTVGDLLSYMRLFALGIATGLLGNSFNSIGQMCLEDISVPVVNIVVMILVLLLGHSINLFMAILGSFVHPMRLTFVEFYKAVGFAGGGIAYRPFSKNK